jgi:DNA-binding CsgD family transcriptional regulator
MEERFASASGSPVPPVIGEYRSAGQSFTRSDLDRARLIADSVVQGISTIEDTIGIADQAMLRGLAALSNGDWATGSHLLSRGLIAAVLVPWQLAQLAADGTVCRDFVSIQARRGAAELHLSLLPGRARLAATSLRATPGGEAAVTRLRSTLLAFVVGSGVARSVLGSQAHQPWLHSLTAAFEQESASIPGHEVRSYGIPRLSVSVRSAQPRRHASPNDRRPALSARERDVLCHIVAGMTTPEISRRLGVKSTTVSTLVGRIFNKLGVNNRAGAVAIALRYGLCGAPDEAHA